jgi:UDP-3-O-[3-hydroxymyristoyl] glucosamine N-acyltransferase
MKPLIFLGSNHNLHVFVDVAKSAGFVIAGIVDDDYHGQGCFQDIPIIGLEEDLAKNFEYWNNFQYFCATNWQPTEFRDPYQERNQVKRERYINLLEQQKYEVATIVSPRAQVCSYNVELGKGVFIDSFCYVNSNVKISDWSIVYGFSTVADSCTIGRNCVLQRKTLITGEVTLEDNVFMAVGSIVNKNHVTIANNTFIQQGIMVLRDTKPYELIGLAGKDLRRVYKILTEE